MNKLIIFSLLLVPSVLYAQEDTLNMKFHPMGDMIEEEASPPPPPNMKFHPVGRDSKKKKRTFLRSNFNSTKENSESSLKVFRLNTNTLAFKKAEEELQSIKEPKRSDYELEAIRMVEALGNYLSLIVNPNTHTDDRTELVDLALSLFINKNMAICNNILFLNKQQINYHYVRDFFEELKKISDVKIEWEITSSTETFELESTQEVIKVVEKIQRSEPTSQKTVQVYFTFQDKSLYGEPKKMYQIKLGDVKCK